MDPLDAGLGATLRAWRDRLSPAAAGLPSRRSRRAQGLRREELADLAGISVDYVVRLEQGRFATPSAQVVAALARALQLTGAERDHLYRLARLIPPAPGRISDHIPPGLNRVLPRLGQAAVAVFAADWQLVWWNRGWAALLGDPSDIAVPLRNFARETFPVSDDGPGLTHWPVASRAGDAVENAVVSDLRRATGLFPADPRLAGLIQLLVEGNARFAHLWEAGVVGAHREDHKIVSHPTVGEIEVDCDVLSGGDEEQRIVILTAEPDSEHAGKFQLALLAGLATAQ